MSEYGIFVNMYEVKNVIQEFKKFALRGNVVDLAVGIIIGASFNSVVRSIVDDVLMPPLGWLFGRVDFSELYINLSRINYESLSAAKEAGAPTINYGLFINSLISFLITAWAVFVLVKVINKMNEQEKKKPKEESKEPEDILLLREIRDNLKKD